MALAALIPQVATVGTDLQAHARDRREHRDLATAQRRLATSRFGLIEATHAHAVTVNHRNGLESLVTEAAGQLATTQESLSEIDAFAFLRGVDIATIHTCLSGVQGAYRQIAAQHDALAARDISSVSAACLTLAGRTNDGVVYPFDFADPDVLTVGGTYFAYATNSVAGNVQIIQSTDLSHWSPVGNALPNLPTWAASDTTWAPAVMQIGGSFVLYYAAVVAGPGGGEECISAATATQPQGPYRDSSTAPLECQPSLGGSIDPSPFTDAGGTPYLLWKSNGGTGSTTIWSEQLDPAGTAMAPATEPTRLLGADEGWQGGVVEAPDLVLAGGHYFLFYSGSNWDTADYAVGVATCSGPLGPCVDGSTQPLLSSGPNFDGPGGASVFADTSGSFWLAFDAWMPGAVGYPHSREFFLRRLDLSGPSPALGRDEVALSSRLTRRPGSSARSGAAGRRPGRSGPPVPAPPMVGVRCVHDQ